MENKQMQENTGKLLVEMKEIVKTFPGTKALDGVTLKLRKGEIHALIGENGAGKSTLMNILTGQFSMDSGEIIMEGEPVRFSSPREAMSRNIVLVPQELNLIPEASIAENIFLGNEVAKKHLIDWNRTQQEAEKLLELLDVKIDVSRPVKELSAAYQQLVSIARALTYEPKVLILDEPTAVLTNRETESLFASMQRLKKNGTAMVFITHHLDEVMEQADRITIMKDGCLVKEILVSEITKEEMINQMAGKKVQIKSPIDAIGYGMGYVSEERRHDGIAPDMSVMENMILPSYDKIKKNGLIDYRQAVRIADQYIGSFKIKTASRETLIKNLSGGNQQKVIVARWMAKGIRMLILDEPTRGIDVNAKGEIHQLIRELADQGVSVVVISSEMEEVIALADRIMVVHNGKISGYITEVDQITQEDVLKVAFQ